MEMESRSSAVISVDLLSSRWLADKPEFLAEAMIDTVRECLLLLDTDLCVRFANRNFFLSFEVTPEETVGRSVFELGNGQWNIPDLRRLLREILPLNNSFRDFEIRHDFPHLGYKIMMLNAQKLRQEDGQSELLLLSIADITARKRLEEEVREREQRLSDLVKEKEILVAEIHHRVKNNLQAVVSLLFLQASHTKDARVVEALSEASGRVQVIARLHESLYASSKLSEINFGDYLRHLVEELKSLHGRAQISFEVDSHDVVLEMEEAVSLGLIANELIVNSLKHAFPSGRAGHVQAAIEYIHESVIPGDSLDTALIRLRVEDDGVGLSPEIVPGKTGTLGLKIVQLLSQQLHGQVEFRSVDGVKACVTFLPRRVA